MSAQDQIEDSSAPLIEHLAELRTRILYSLAAFITAMVICYAVWNPIFNFLTGPICEALADRGQQCGLYLIKLQEGFFVAINISFLGGFALAFTFFLGFQQGGLDAADAANEMAAIGFQGSVQEYLSLTIKFVMAFGICFQLPVLLSLMGKAGLVSAKGLAGMRKYAVVAILVVAAVATPPDVISQVILFTVVYGLYEVSIQLVARIEAARKKRMIAEGTWFEDEDLEAEFDEDEDEAGGKA